MLHILLIDDSAFFRKFAGLQFTEPNYYLETEMTGKAGLEKALNFDYDLVITDLNLPDLSGLELIQALRVHKKDLPVILNSTQDSLDALNLSDLDSKIYFCDKQISGLLAKVGEILTLQK